MTQIAPMQETSKRTARNGNATIRQWTASGASFEGVQKRGDGMSSYCDYIDGNCKYSEEGHCDFPVQGSGYPYEAPCFGYEKEDDEGEWLPVMANKRMLKCSNCLFWVSKELITAWEKYPVMAEQIKGVEVAIGYVELIPSAQPEIIRCKDCKHWIPYDWMFSEVWRSKNMADYPEDEIGCDCCDMAMKADDFCSRGEKREVTT